MAGCKSPPLHSTCPGVAQFFDQELLSWEKSLTEGWECASPWAQRSQAEGAAWRQQPCLSRLGVPTTPNSVGLEEATYVTVRSASRPVGLALGSTVPDWALHSAGHSGHKHSGSCCAFSFFKIFEDSSPAA